MNGLNHGRSSVSTQLGPDATAPLMIRLLFLAGPWVTSIVNPTRSSGWAARGLRLDPSADSPAPEVGFRNVTS